MLRTTPFLQRCCLAVSLAWLLLAALSSGCGGESGSDSDEASEPAEGSSDAGQDDGPDGDLGDLPALDGAIGECLSCLTSSCPEAQACVEDPVCVERSFCAFTTCVSPDAGGSGELACWLGCFDDDPAAALSAFAAFTCAVTTCGMGCAGSLGP